jgi:hypothetical protein
MSETGQNITDGSKYFTHVSENRPNRYLNFFTYSKAPLERIKKAMVDIKGDMKNMDIRIGVLEHVLLQAKLKQKDLIHEQREK